MQKKYSKYYSEKSLWEKIKKFSKVAGVQVVYAVLLLYYAMSSKNVDVKTKLFIAASLGYFILPTDAIFDLTPIIGYSSTKDRVLIKSLMVRRIASLFRGVSSRLHPEPIRGRSLTYDRTGFFLHSIR